MIGSVQSGGLAAFAAGSDRTEMFVFDPNYGKTGIEIGQLDLPGRRFGISVPICPQ